MISVLVVDDEPLARQRLTQLIELIAGYQVVSQAQNGAEALEFCAHHAVDILCLDIHMPGLDGFDVAKQLAESTPEERLPALIFCTAFSDYALEAFEANAVDYLLKPINQQKLENALDKAKRLSAGQLSAVVSMAQSQESTGDSALDKTHLTVKRRSGFHRIALTDIRALVAEHKYVNVYHSEGEDLIDDSLKQIETNYPDCFVRVHRNALISLPHVMAMERDALGRYQLTLADIEFKPVVSRRHVSSLRQRLASQP